jgi:hypothetical protein
METMETNDQSEKNGTFGHFMIIFVGFIAALVGISWLVLSLLK